MMDEKHTEASLENDSPSSSPQSMSPKPLKYILYYKQYWGSEDFQFGLGQQPFYEFGCRVPYCYATSNHSLLDSMGDFDAMLFHMPASDMPAGTASHEWTWRQPHQLFVMLSMESPLNDRHNYRKDYAGFFNATMSYRLDSDFPRPYGWFQRKQVLPGHQQQPNIRQKQHHHHKQHQHQPNDEEKDAWSITAKSQRQRQWIPYHEQRFVNSLSKRDASFLALANRFKKVAWVVSHCPTVIFREDYVKELQEHIDVDIYGKCGTVLCDAKYQSFMSGMCVSAIPQTYKFYIGFENAFCDDYVTEKFFERVNDHVVIVLGQANYSQIAPPHSYINAMDYDSPQHLAQYLHHLDQNPREYLSYFWWKDYYDVLFPSRAFFAPAMCRLCERLHQQPDDKAITLQHASDNTSNASGVSTTVYQDMEQWWRGDAHCGDLMPAWKRKSPRIGAMAMKMSKRIGSSRNSLHKFGSPRWEASRRVGALQTGRGTGGDGSGGVGGAKWQRHRTAFGGTFPVAKHRLEKETVHENGHPGNNEAKGYTKMGKLQRTRMRQ